MLAAHLQQAAEEAARNLAAAQAHAAELQQQQEAARLQAQEGRARKAQEAKRKAAYAEKKTDVMAAVTSLVFSAYAACRLASWECQGGKGPGREGERRVWPEGSTAECPALSARLWPGCSPC